MGMDGLACKFLPILYNPIFFHLRLVLLAACIMLVSIFAFNPENVNDMFLRNVGWLSPDFTVLYPRRYNSSFPISNFMQICLVIIKLLHKTNGQLVMVKSTGTLLQLFIVN
jgi:hypothetical protein